jgi:amino acid adenylation domain-containing protein
VTLRSRRERLGQLSADQRALLEHWVLSHAASGGAPRPARSADIVAPLSFAQERLWFLDRLAPGTSLYNMYSALEFRAPVDLDALRATLDEVCRRHDMLRTTLRAEGGAPVQVIAPPRARPLDVVDLRDLDPSLQAAEVLRQRREDAARPFDLSHGPLFRHRLLQLGDERSLLLLSLHHIVSDGWSMDVLHREIQVLYDGFSRGRPPALPELPVQYVDFVRWQRRTLTGDKLADLLRYWRTELDGVPPLLPLPADRPRPPVQSFQGRTVAFLIPAPERDALMKLARQEGVTLFMTLLSAFGALLGWYASTTDVVVGCPIANRTRTELEGLIGFFVNTLALRVRLDGDPTFSELLARVKETTLGAYAHQDMPFERLVEDLHPARSLAHNPLVQVMFTLQNTPAGRTMGGTPDDADGPVPSMAKFDLTLSLAESDEGLVGAIEYATALFDLTRIRRLIGHLLTLIRDVTAHPHIKLSRLRLLTDDELDAWRRDLTGADTPRVLDRCAHSVLEETATRWPESPAIDASGHVLSYAGLNDAATRLARRLQAAGVGPEVRVALALPRGIDAVTAVFAILKAGGAFVPLDLGLPPARQAQILGGAGVTHAVAGGAARAALEALHLRVVDPQVDDGAAADGDARPLDPVDPGQLAYVMHTSGSTGAPKGVLIEHRSVVNMMEAHASWFGDDAMTEARVLQFASLSFDAAIFEIMHAVRLGACLVIPPPEAVLAGADLGRALAALRITFAVLPPSILAGVPARDLPALRVILTGGEACTADLIDRWAPGRAFFNAYGPTEVTVWVTAAACEPGDAPPPIGRPMPHAGVRLLDPRLRPTPIGVAGEMYVTGAGLARGYANRPGWTADRFIPDPFSDEPGARMYRTGDLARRREDGQLTFVGRTDDQVKVRGFRIEPGEIEATLRRHPAVGLAAVVATGAGGPWHETLVAFWTPRAGAHEQATGAALRDFLRAHLPEAWVPSSIEPLAVMPLGPNGKVDRAALPHAARQPADDRRVPPRTEIEQTLAEIVAEVLDLTEVGVFDNFFDLGGHSLRATRVLARAQESYGVELGLRPFFEEPTVAALARAVDAARHVPGAAPAPLVRVAREGYRAKPEPGAPLADRALLAHGKGQ